MIPTNRIATPDPSEHAPSFSKVEWFEATLMIYLGMVDKREIPPGTALANDDPKIFRKLVRGSMKIASDQLQTPEGQSSLSKLRELLQDT